MRKDKTLLELVLGIFLLAVLMQIILLLFFEKHLYDAVGLWCGVIVSCFFSIHMNHSIEETLDLDEERGTRRAVKGYITRMILSAIPVVAVLYLDIGNPFTILLGVTTLKIAAYLQPSIHKITLTIQKKGGRYRGK